MIIPPKYAVCKVIETIKKNTSKSLSRKFAFLKKVIYWDRKLELLEKLRTRISSIESILAQLKENDEIVEGLKTIPGIGEFFAMLIRYEMDRIDRFSALDKLCSYAGLVPSTYSSGGKTYHGRIIKQGNKYLRWALIEAVIPAIRKDAQIRRYYNSMKAKKGSNSAKVATTRRLLKIVSSL
jgi:transposase